MSSGKVYSLDQKTLELFAMKGIEGGSGSLHMTNVNALKVRRVMQLISDFSKKPFNQLRILDLACGEGVYAIEAALRGAHVIAIDARTERMNEGANAADRLSLNNLYFEQNDVRNVNVESHGKADIVLLLGILYHLNENDVFPVLQNLYDMCNQFVIIDTHIALNSETIVKHDGVNYEGKYYREHADNDSVLVRRNRLLASIDNSLSFWFTLESLFCMLINIGFTAVCECNVPTEISKPEDRITLIAVKGEPVKLSSYPWLNEMTEEEIRCALQNDHQKLNINKRREKSLYIKHSSKSLVRNLLHSLASWGKRD